MGALADAVGAAYGLTGNHLEWAKTSETELKARIDQAMPALLAAAPAPRAASVADSFFGESDSLEAMGDPFAAAGASAVAAGNPVAWPPDNPPPSDYIAGVPKASKNTLLIVAVGGGALLVGIALVIVFVLLR